MAEITPAKASTSLPPRYGGEGGGLSKKLIHDVIHARGEQVEACYWEAQQGKPLLEGRVDVRFVISLTGEVCAAEARQNTTGSEALERCLLGQVARMRFPAPTGGDVIVVYPYLFNPPQAARAGALSDGP